VRKWRLLLAVALAAAAAGACSRRPADPVAALLADLERAAEARDATAFGERLSASFRDEHGLGRDEAVQQLKRWFAGYETVKIEVYSVETDRSGPSAARVRCVVEFSGQGRRLLGLEGLLPPSAAYRFELDVADEGGWWRVRGASYEPIGPSEPPADPPAR
jgi:hypothetical protein